MTSTENRTSPEDPFMAARPARVKLPLTGPNAPTIACPSGRQAYLESRVKDADRRSRQARGLGTAQSAAKAAEGYRQEIADLAAAHAAWVTEMTALAEQTFALIDASEDR